MRNPSTTTRVVYAADQETYLQRQLREFYNPSRRTHTEAAAWAEEFDPLNGKTAGEREKLGAFGKPQEEA